MGPEAGSTGLEVGAASLGPGEVGLDGDWTEGPAVFPPLVVVWPNVAMAAAPDAPRMTTSVPLFETLRI